jgi:hypothetical protein
VLTLKSIVLLKVQHLLLLPASRELVQTSNLLLLQMLIVLPGYPLVLYMEILAQPPQPVQAIL